VKLGVEFITPFQARILEILSSATIRSDWKRATVVHIYKGGDRLSVANSRHVSLTSVVCKQLEHVIAGYLSQVWDKSDWLYEGEHGFSP
jgi:hypothetical protein